MTSNMVKSQKKILVGDRYVDRLSSLPEDVIELIMNFMPTHDSARTCLLSSTWRYTWANHPSVVLDDRFLDDIQRGRLPNEFVTDYPTIVSRILRQHIGQIREFVIYISLALSTMPHINIDSWLSYTCGKGLKVLNLINCGRNPYVVPCLVFSSSELVELNLSFCIIRSGCFTNIQTLILERVTFESSVVFTTHLLTYLELVRCSGIIHFDISAPRLDVLILRGNDELNLKPFLSCTGIARVFLSSITTHAHVEGCECISLPKLLAAWPRISDLVLDGFCFKYLAAGGIPCKLDLLKLSSLGILDLSLDSNLMPWFLCILKSSPLLHSLLVLFSDYDLDEINSDGINESRSVLDFQMNHLHIIYLKGFTATPNEVVLAKILLQCAPVLKEMNVEEYTELDAEERVRILENLLSLQHAYPKPRIVFGRN